MDEIQRQRLNTHIHDILFRVVDWILPPSCPGCGLEGEIICKECGSKIVRLVGKHCQFCGQAVRGADICGDCRNRPHSYEAYRGYGVYTGVLRDAILRLKYQNDIGIAKILAQYLENVVQTTNWDFEIVVPVPLSPQKHEERGYNQASRLAKPLAARLGKLYRPEALTRIRETSSQVGLDIQARLENVQNAFRADPKIVKGKSILLVDDVFTTGATLESAASELKIADAKHVYALTLAKSVRNVNFFE
mgnify:CR=1 FL=1